MFAPLSVVLIQCSMKLLIMTCLLNSGSPKNVQNISIFIVSSFNLMPSLKWEALQSSHWLLAMMLNSHDYEPRDRPSVNTEKQGDLVYNQFSKYSFS